MSIRQKRVGRPGLQRAAASENVIDGLRRQYDKLTQSQKRIAEYIVDNAQAVAFSNVDQMATELGVNPSTIVRFAYRLGLKGFPDLQERVRQLIRGQLSAANEVSGITSVGSHLEGSVFGTSLTQDLQNIGRTIATVNIETLSRACKLIGESRRVYVQGAFASHAVAYYLSLALDRIRGGTTLCNSESGLLQSQLLDLQPQDCLVAFSSAPYAVVTYRTAQLVKQVGGKVVAITDTPISAVGQVADLIISAPSTGSGAQNSLVAPMAVANALLNGVAGANSPRTLERYERLNRLTNEWDNFLLKGEG